ncbi:MAG: flavin reductase family protein [bacterium]
MSNLHLWNKSDLENMEQRYRAQFVNSLPGIKTPFLVGTQSSNGATNLAIVSSVTHLGSSPALMSMMMRPNTVERHTIENLKENSFYTFNAVDINSIAKAHQTSARYPRDISEFKACGFHEIWEPDFEAPFVKESVLQIGLKLVQVLHLEINGCDLVIGEIVIVKAPFQSLSDDGSINIDQLDLASVSGLDRYHKSQKVMRLSYAKPDLKPLVIDK